MEEGLQVAERREPAARMSCALWNHPPLVFSVLKIRSLAKFVGIQNFESNLPRCDIVASLVVRIDSFSGNMCVYIVGT